VEYGLDFKSQAAYDMDMMDLQRERVAYLSFAKYNHLGVGWGGGFSDSRDGWCELYALGSHTYRQTDRQLRDSNGLERYIQKDRLSSKVL
jgi:hypothetical protein